MAKLDFESDPQQLTIDESVARLRQIQSGLKQAIDKLHEKLELLDCEPALQSGLQTLREDIELRATNLEAEVKRLRGDLKTVKDLLGLDFRKEQPES